MNEENTRLSASLLIFLEISKILLNFTLTSMVYCCQLGEGGMALITIQEVAKQFNVSTRTIRYYEELGLLCPHRSSTNQRTFSRKELAKLKLIFRGKRYGFSLEEIKEMVLLFDFDRSGIQQLERTVEYEEQKIQEIDHKIAELTQMKQELQQMHSMFNEKLATLKGEMHDE